MHCKRFKPYRPNNCAKKKETHTVVMTHAVALKVAVCKCTLHILWSIHMAMLTSRNMQSLCQWIIAAMHLESNHNQMVAVHCLIWLWVDGAQLIGSHFGRIIVAFPIYAVALSLWIWQASCWLIFFSTSTIHFLFHSSVVYKLRK